MQPIIKFLVTTPIGIIILIAVPIAIIVLIVYLRTRSDKLTRMVKKESFAGLEKYIENPPAALDKEDALIEVMQCGIIEGKIHVVEWLLDKGVTIKVSEEDVYYPLHDAVLFEQVEIVELLLKNHADPNGMDSDGESVLGLAVEFENEEIVNLLLKHGANPNTITGEEHLSPLHLAMFCSNENILRELLDFGADPDIKAGKGEYEGKSVLELAREEGYEVLLNMIKGGEKY